MTNANNTVSAPLHTVFDAPVEIVAVPVWDDLLGQTEVAGCESWADVDRDGKLIPAFVKSYRGHADNSCTLAWGVRYKDCFDSRAWPEMNRKVRAALRKHFPASK